MKRARSTPKPGPKTPETCPVPLLSGPITQTSPGTERGGGVGKTKYEKANPTLSQKL